MKQDTHYPRLSLIYQGSLLLLAMVLSRLIPTGMVTINQIIDTPFTSWESWLVIALTIGILILTWNWALKHQLMKTFSLSKSGLKAIGWGFLTIFLIGFIGSNLMLLTRSSYDTSLQETLGIIPLLPQAMTMLAASVLEEFFFRGWLFSWFKERSFWPILISTGLFCLYHFPTNIGHLFLYLGMGFALSRVYQTSQNLSAAISLHLLWNAFTLIMTILIMV